MSSILARLGRAIGVDPPRPKGPPELPDADREIRELRHTAKNAAQRAVFASTNARRSLMEMPLVQVAEMIELAARRGGPR